MENSPTLQEILFTLLLKVGVASSIAALLVRWNTFRRVLFTEERDSDQKLKLLLFMTPPLLVGVTLRLVSPAYRFADLSLEVAFLMGLLAGPWWVRWEARSRPSPHCIPTDPCRCL